MLSLLWVEKAGFTRFMHLNVEDCIMLLSYCIGLGIKKDRDEAWIEHQDDFDQILANLNAQTMSSTTDQSDADSPQAAKALLETATESKRLLYEL